ncbi:MAG TPA: MOSC N-terminal beta barrel domain-containing protein [Gemmatimonadales bacterium]|nr:MOSC N-terminal beta barrel domain-containing protein [Gemmatimonadales bacterium]
MLDSTEPMVGRVAALWRYPVKSLLGEMLEQVEVSESGLAGDRVWALRDRADGKVASAKDLRRWPDLFAYRAECVGSDVRITLPDGTSIHGGEPDAERRLSAALGRAVVLSAAVAPARFFDDAIVHLLTTATLDGLRAFHPAGRFDARRFRPNLVVASPPDATPFGEHAWVGRTLSVGAVRLVVTAPCLRCVMTTLPQTDLPKDPAILRTAAERNHAAVGVYAAVVRGGTLRRGDAARLLE